MRKRRHKKKYQIQASNAGHGTEPREDQLAPIPQRLEARKILSRDLESCECSQYTVLNEQRWLWWAKATGDHKKSPISLCGFHKMSAEAFVRSCSLSGCVCGPRFEAELCRRPRRDSSSAMKRQLQAAYTAYLANDNTSTRLPYASPTNSHSSRPQTVLENRENAIMREVEIVSQDFQSFSTQAAKFFI